CTEREPLLALRAEAAQIPTRGSDANVVEVRPEPGRATRDVDVETRFQRVCRGRLALVGERRRGETKLACALAECRRELRERPPSRIDEPCTELCDALRPRNERITARQAELHTPQCRVPLREGRGVLLRERRLRRLQ